MSNPKNELKRAKAAMVLARKLEAAADAMRQFVHACVDCGENYPYANDQRIRMQEDLREYSDYLEKAYRNKTALDEVPA